MTGGESGHKYVDASVVRLIVLKVGDSDLTYVIKWVGHQSEEVRGILGYFGCGFENILSRLAPEAATAVKQEFGGGFASSGVFWKSLGSSVMLSNSLFLTYRALSWSVCGTNIILICASVDDLNNHTTI